MKQPIKSILWVISAVTFFLTMNVFAKEQAVSFLGQSYRLGSFNQKANPMWEFVRPTETVNNWTTLLTIIDRPDAKSRIDLDRLAQGVLENYKSRSGQILMAKTMKDASGTPYNYAVVAFEVPSKHQFELNFIKAAMGPRNAYLMIYGVRIGDPNNYVVLSKKFLTEHSSEIGKELEKSQLPETGSLPRKEF